MGLALFGTATLASPKIGVSIIGMEREGIAELGFTHDSHGVIGRAALHEEAMRMLDHSIVDKRLMLNSVAIAHHTKSMGEVFIWLGVYDRTIFRRTIVIWYQAVTGLVDLYLNFRTIFIRRNIKITSIEFPANPYCGAFPRVLVENLKVNWLANLKWPIADVNKKWIQPCAVGVNISLIRMVYAAKNEKQTTDSYNCGTQSNSVQYPTDYNLSVPKKIFLGAVMLGFGLWLSCFGIAIARFSLWLIGWPTGVAGGVILLLLLLPDSTAGYRQRYCFNNTNQTQGDHGNNILDVRRENI